MQYGEVPLYSLDICYFYYTILNNCASFHLTFKSKLSHTLLYHITVDIPYLFYIIQI